MSLKMIILWPLYILVFLKILSFLPTADRQKCLFLSYLMSEFFRTLLDSRMGNILALCFVFQKVVPFWSCTEINLRSPFIHILYSSLFILIPFFLPCCPF